MRRVQAWTLDHLPAPRLCIQGSTQACRLRVWSISAIAAELRSGGIPDSFINDIEAEGDKTSSNRIS
jgi:hypothetical protein